MAVVEWLLTGFQIIGFASTIFWIVLIWSVLRSE